MEKLLLILEFSLLCFFVHHLKTNKHLLKSTKFYAISTILVVLFIIFVFCYLVINNLRE
jgi:hypothetical protein